jgi:hypothetical protein
MNGRWWVSAGHAVAGVAFGFARLSLADPFVSVRIGADTAAVQHVPSVSSGFRNWTSGDASKSNSPGNSEQSVAAFSSASATKIFGTGMPSKDAGAAAYARDDAPLPAQYVPSGRLAVSLTAVDLTFGDQRSPGVGKNTSSIEFITRDRIPNIAGLSYGDLYSGFAIAIPVSDSTHSKPLPVSTDGTSHRMLIEFSGLKPGQEYSFKFYAYDNSNRRGVFVFTDVTHDPLAPMKCANAQADTNFPTAGSFPILGMFIPGRGDYRDGTQYAPDGQYIWTNGLAPTSNDRYSVTLPATADSSGKIIFAETTVVGLGDKPQNYPVLNGFEIEAASADVHARNGAQ